MAEEQVEGRSSSFVNAALSQSPVAKFRSLQQGAGKRGFRPDSTLTQNQILTGANGESNTDYQRNPLRRKDLPSSPNGQSDSTLQSRMWLGSSPRS